MKKISMDKPFSFLIGKKAGDIIDEPEVIPRVHKDSPFFYAAIIDVIDSISNELRFPHSRHYNRFF